MHPRLKKERCVRPAHAHPCSSASRHRKAKGLGSETSGKYAGGLCVSLAGGEGPGGSRCGSFAIGSKLAEFGPESVEHSGLTWPISVFGHSGPEQDRSQHRCRTGATSTRVSPIRATFSLFMPDCTAVVPAYSQRARTGNSPRALCACSGVCDCAHPPHRTLDRSTDLDPRCESSAAGGLAPPRHSVCPRSPFKARAFRRLGRPIPDDRQPVESPYSSEHLGCMRGGAPPCRRLKVGDGTLGPQSQGGQKTLPDLPSQRSESDEGRCRGRFSMRRSRILCSRAAWTPSGRAARRCRCSWRSCGGLTCPAGAADALRPPPGRPRPGARRPRRSDVTFSATERWFCVAFRCLCGHHRGRAGVGAPPPRGRPRMRLASRSAALGGGVLTSLGLRGKGRRLPMFVQLRALRGRTRHIFGAAPGLFSPSPIS